MKTLILAAIRCSLMFTAVVAFSLAPPAKANLITNPGFETGDFTGWTPSVGEFVAGEFDSIAPHSGNYEAVSRGGTLGQTLATIPGHTYFVSFWYANFTFPGDFQFLEVTWGDEVQVHLTGGSGFRPYTQFTFSVPATSASTELQFLFSSDSFLDDVSVNPRVVGVPDGGSTVYLLGFASLGLAAVRRKLCC